MKKFGFHEFKLMLNTIIQRPMMLNDLVTRAILENKEKVHKIVFVNRKLELRYTVKICPTLLEADELCSQLTKTNNATPLPNSDHCFELFQRN